MKPYFEDGQVTLYCGDALEVLPGLGPVDAVVTDPPYNVGVDYGAGVDDRQPSAAYARWCREWFGACRALAPVVAFTPGIVNLALWCAVAPPTWVLAWLKAGKTGHSPLGFNRWEPVLVWGTPPLRVSSDVFDAYLPQRHGRKDGRQAHPCAKPTLWGKHLVSRLTLPGATVLDPFAGTGATLHAARELGRRVIGIEVNPDYCAAAVEGLRQGVLPLAEAVPPLRPVRRIELARRRGRDAARGAPDLFTVHER